MVIRELQIYRRGDLQKMFVGRPVTRGARRLALTILLLSATLLTSCDVFVTNSGKRPQYENYITGSYSLRDLGIMPVADSDVALQFIAPQPSAAADSSIFPDGAATGSVILGYRPGALYPRRAMLFSSDLELEYDVSDLDDSYGAFQGMVNLPHLWQYSGGGEVDLGYLLYNLDTGVYTTRSRNSTEHYLSYLDAGDPGWRDYLITSDGGNGYLNLSMYSYYSYYNTSDNAISNSTTLIANGTDAQAILSTAGLGDLYSDSDNFTIIDVIESDETSSYVIVVGATLDNDSRYLLFYFIDGTSDPSGWNPVTIDSTAAVSARFYGNWDNYHFNYDGTYFAVIDSHEDLYDLGDLSDPDVRVDIYQFIGSSSLTAGVSWEGSFQYDSMFSPGNVDRDSFGIDFDFTFSDALGSWFLYQRSSNRVYSLSIGKGGW